MSQDINERFVSRITEKEVIEFMKEGLLQASDAALRLAKAQNHPIWEDISKLMLEMYNRGVQLAKGKSLSRTTTLQMIDDRQRRKSDELDLTRPANRNIIIP